MMMGVFVLFALPSMVIAQAQSSTGIGKTADDGTVEVSKGFRASHLIGMSVKNDKGEEIGTVKDLVLNVENGKVAYAALSFGGFLGFGDKLFAVPWQELRFKFDENETHLVADLSPEKLKNAPGFNKDNWPDVTKEGWSALVDQYYARPFHTGIVVAVEHGKLTMTDMEGKSEHSHAIGPKVTVTLDDHPAQLDDLKKGFRVKVTTENRDGKNVVTRIDAHSAAHSQA